MTFLLIFHRNVLIFHGLKDIWIWVFKSKVKWENHTLIYNSMISKIYSHIPRLSMI